MDMAARDSGNPVWMNAAHERPVTKAEIEALMVDQPFGGTSDDNSILRR